MVGEFYWLRNVEASSFVFGIIARLLARINLTTNEGDRCLLGFQTRVDMKARRC